MRFPSSRQRVGHGRTLLAGQLGSAPCSPRIVPPGAPPSGPPYVGDPTCGGRSGCSASSATSSPTRLASTPRSPRTPSGSSRSTSTSTAGCCSTSAAARATSATAFEAAGATYFALDADVGELSGSGEDRARGRTVIGSGMQLPFADASVDVCYSSNVLEHVADPWRMADEMLRVTRPGGTVLHQLHGLVRPVGRPRDLAVALPRRPPRPPPLRREARPRAEEQVRRVAVRRHRARRSALGATGRRAPRSSPSSRATTRGGRCWLLRVPGRCARW